MVGLLYVKYSTLDCALNTNTCTRFHLVL